MISHNASKELLLHTLNEYVQGYNSKKRNIEITIWLPTLLFKTLIEHLNYEKSDHDCIFHGTFNTYIYFDEFSVFSKKTTWGLVNDAGKRKEFIHLKYILKNGFLYKSKLYYYD